MKKFIKTRKNKHLDKARKSTKSRIVAAIRPDILLKNSSTTYSVHGSSIVWLKNGFTELVKC
ncbi:hypothetical protein D917_07068 [Trichinella nativa]|uniref:Uncharacterized protein n=1 Tax=Trichinella nativa TaxID=6335 RepID=A0A1Y3EUR5_9BILA|nr:hypothetical protein D917_07068 [Trichinella nativa]